MKIELNVQFGKTSTADLEEKTWTFLMDDIFKVRAGEFAIMPKEVYTEMLESHQQLTNAIRQRGFAGHFSDCLKYSDTIINKALGKEESNE